MHPEPIQFESELTTLPATVATAVIMGHKGATAVAYQLVRGRPLLDLEIENVGATNAFTACTVDVFNHPNGTWRTVLSAFGTAGQYLWDVARRADGTATTPVTLAAASVVGMSLYLGGAYAFRVVLTSTSGTTAKIRGTLVR